MKALILAAGMGKRLMPLTQDTPKCLLKVGGKTIIEHQFDALYKNNIKDIVIVIGHQGEKIKRLIGDKARYIENNDFATTNSSYSLWLAREEMKDGFIYVNSDLIFHWKILQDLINSKSENAIVTDNRVKIDSDMQKIKLDGSQIVIMGKEIPVDEAQGEAVGPVKINQTGAKKVLERIENLINQNKKNYWAYSVFSDCAQEIGLKKVDCQEPWVEIDYLKDIEKANQMIHLIEKEYQNNELKEDFMKNENFEAEQLKDMGFEDSFIVSSNVGKWERKCNKKIIKTHIGTPSFNMPGVVKNAIIQGISSDKVNYTPTRGIFDLRKVLLEREYEEKRKI